MKTLKNFIPIYIFLFCLSCSNKDETGGNNLSLQGVKWKLIGFADTQTGTLKEAEPVSEKCYLLTFNDDNTFEGISSTNQIAGTYVLEKEASSIHITKIGGTEINELFDGKLYVESLAAIQSFLVTEGTLKLYYNDQKQYLLFSKTE